MASTDLGAQLTASHYMQQVAVQADTVRALQRLFPALDLSSFAAVDRSWPALDEALRALIGRNYATSSGLAANYFDLFRAAEDVAGRASPVLADVLPVEQVEIGLRVTGPFTAKHLIAARDAQAATKTFARLSGALSRLVATGGRETLRRSVEADPQAVGWARVTSGRACAFCRLLASRGAVYKRSTVRFRAHDHCGCTSEPRYRDDAPLPPNAQRDLDLYREVSAGLSGKDAIAAFRQAVEAR